jgi:glycosyltransferase involved in cell wall biosynthesis
LAERKKVLILTYYWPPSGGTGVQRWLHFTRYLHELGWDPIIYTPSNPEAPVQDESLLAFVPKDIQVIQTEIWEPTQLYLKFTGNAGKQLHTGFLQEKGGKKPGLTKRLSMWLRANLFVPDAKMAWIKPSTKFLIKFLQEQEVAAIISTGPPHSLHLIARNLKAKTKLPWIADFRDPWTQIDWFEQLPLTNWGLRWHQKLEQSVLKQADALVVVSRDMQTQMTQLADRVPQLISNGFAPEDFQHFEKQADPHFTILHTGSINKDRNPGALWRSLGLYVQEHPDFAQKLKIRLIGALDACVQEDLQANGLLPYTHFENFVPHEQVLEELSACSLLLLPLNNVKSQKGIVTGKLFEYLASEQAILAIGPHDGDAAAILSKQAGTMVINFDTAVPWPAVIELTSQQISRKDTLLPYSRKELAKEMHELLESIIKS